jgi:hypothetical protein
MDEQVNDSAIEPRVHKSESSSPLFRIGMRELGALRVVQRHSPTVRNSLE